MDIVELSCNEFVCMCVQLNSLLSITRTYFTADIAVVGVVHIYCVRIHT